MGKPTKSRKDTKEWSYAFYRCRGIMRNCELYRKLIMAIVEKKYEHYLENRSKIQDDEIIRILALVYKNEPAVLKNVNLIRMMFQKYHEHIKADIASYKADKKNILYPPYHVIHTHRKLFPSLDKMILEIFDSPTVPAKIRIDFVRRAVYDMNRGSRNHELSKTYMCHLKRETITWFAFKIIPKKFHLYIRTRCCMKEILRIISFRADIPMEQLKILIQEQYAKLRSELMNRENSEEQSSDSQIEPSENTQMIEGGNTEEKESSENEIVNQSTNHENPKAETSLQLRQSSPVERESSSLKTSTNNKNLRNYKTIMRNIELYNKLIKLLAENRWEILLKKHAEYDDDKILPLLELVYGNKKQAELNINILRAMLKDYRKKIKEDIKNYINNSDTILYPPDHKKYIQNQLFPFLDKNMSRIFQSTKFPTKIPAHILQKATMYFSDQSHMMSDSGRFRTQCCNWLAIKLLPEKFHIYLGYGRTFNLILNEVSRNAAITRDELTKQIENNYRKIRSKLLVTDDEQNKMHTDDDAEANYEDVDYAYEASEEEEEDDDNIEHASTTDVPMKETDNLLLMPTNDGITETKITDEPDVSAKVTADKSPTEHVEVLSDDDSVCIIEYPEHTIAHENIVDDDVLIEKIVSPQLSLVKDEMTGMKIKVESDVRHESVIVGNSSGTSIIFNVRPLDSIKCLENIGDTDVPIEEVVNLKMKPTSVGNVEELLQIDSDIYIEKEISPYGTVKRFKQSDDSNPRTTRDVDRITLQLHQLSPYKQQLMLKTFRWMKRWLDNSMLKQTRLMKLMEKRTQMVDVRIRKLTARHARFQELMSKKMEMMETAAMVKQRRILKIMAELSEERLDIPFSD